MACSSRNCDPPAPASSAHAQSNSRFHPAEEWRSWDQLEASPPSPSLPCWDSDDDDESGSSVSGPRPSDLYGKFTWKIENFSQISKRELRSNVFEVGGYKWYILVYPQGCDVCNHLSLFLCVADYDKLLPGWSHFAQFTIAVVNKDPKKSKYSDTLHRFCKKEHDWGWKKFMELSKVLDGFTVADTLVIKAQVQIIRENPHCPFRCLDCQYRRELVRVYLTNVEGICRRFVEEKREKLTKLMEDSVRWSSFRSFWTAVEESVRRRLSREKSDVILKAVVKRFFNETEVTSTLVMDALHSGCKALNIQSKNKKGKSNGLELEETVKPIVWMDKDVFILAGDVLSLLERAATEPLPPYKDDKGPQNRTKDGSSGDDFGRDSVERDERRLTELGRRTIEMFVLAHLFSHVEVAYREAIALKRQEELIREEEAAGQAEIESKAKREAAEKERRTRKKQAKQRRTSRKERDKEVEVKREAVAQEPQQRDDTANEKVTKAYLLKGHAISSIMIGDDDDELSGLETTDEIMGTLEPPIEDVDVGEAVWEMEGSDMHGGIEASFSGGLCEGSTQNGQSIKNCQQTFLDDGSSTCSSDSFPSVSAVSNGSVRGSFTLSDRNHISPSRGRERVDIEGYDKVLRLMESDGMLRVSLDASCTAEPSSSGSSAGLDPEMVVASLRERVQWLEQRLAEKEQEVVMLREQLRLFPQICAGRPNQDRFPMEGSTDRCQTHRTQDVGPSSSSNVCNGRSESPTSTEVNEDKIDPEMTMNRTSMVPGASVNITNEFIRHNDHDPSRPDKLRCDASRCSQIANGNIIAQGKSASSSLPPALSNCSSEVLVSASSINIGAPSSTSTVQVMGFSRSLNAPVLPAAARPSLPVTEIHSAPLSSSVGVVGQLGRTNKEAGGSGNPALIQGPPVMPSYRNAAAGKMRSGNSASEGGQFISAAASAVTSSCSSQPLPYMNHAFVHIPQHISPSLPCTTGSHSQMLPFPHNMPAVCGQAVPVSTINMKAAEAFEATCTPITTADGEGVMVVDGLGNILNRQSESARLSMGITFGTITPEMFHAQRHQDQQHKCNISGGHAEGYFLNEEGYFLKEDCYLQAHQTDQLLLQQAQEQQIRQGHNYHHQRLIHHDLHPQQSQKYHQMHQQGFPEFGPGNGAVRRTLATVAENVNNGYMMSDEFPHLDIINDLLDEDRNFEKALSALLQQPGNQGLNCLPSFPEPHRMNSGQRRLETCTFHGKCSSECERGITCNDDLLQMHSTEDCINTGLRDTTQVVGPFAHSPLLRSFIHHEESTEEISRHHWPGVNVNMPVSSNANGIDRRGYPLPNHHIRHHIPVAECAATSLDQNGYTTYASMRQL